MKRHALFLWVALFSVAYLLGNFLYRLEVDRIPELPFETRVVPESGLIVTETDPDTVAAGLQKGDRILSIDGRPTIENQYYFLRAHRFAQPGEKAVIEVDIGESSKKALVRWREPVRRKARLKPAGSSMDSRLFFFELLLPLSLIAIAATLNFSLAEGPGKTPASLMILSQTVWFPGEPKLLWPAGLRETGYLFNGVFGPLFFLFALMFFTRFPFPLAAERKVPWLKWALLIALVALGMVSAVHSLSGIYHFDLYVLTSRYIDLNIKAIQILWLLCFVAITLSQARTLDQISTYQGRRLMFIWAGIFIGFFPPALLLFAGQLMDPQLGITVFPAWLQMLAFLFFLAFPLSVAIAVIGWRKSV